jgi:2,3,4,5-tetrahydropyridine-2-carboxylate N-succinyltransferase
MSDNSSPAWGYGIATVDLATKTVLDTWYPQPHLGAPPANFDNHVIPASITQLEGEDTLRGVEMVAVATLIDLSDAPTSTADAYLRLHLLSHCLVVPNSVNLEGIFGILPVVAFTTKGPVSPEFFDSHRFELMGAGVSMTSLDKFGPLLNYVTPEKVRIADASRVRLGAHLAPGTTVMHEGFVNFNAGTLGPSMVEGRISQGVIIGEGTDIGGGASIMGTLSGGGKEVISLGKNCLLGANSGVGISLGDDCVVEAGLYVTAGTKVAHSVSGEIKAAKLSGVSGLLFRRNSSTGAVEAIFRNKFADPLNPALHS